MHPAKPTIIPSRAETLKVLQLMGKHQPILMLGGPDLGYGTCWILDGQQVHPAIAHYLMNEGFIEEAGITELGAKMLTLTAAGKRFRENGYRWWASLDFFQRIKIIVLG